MTVGSPGTTSMRRREFVLRLPVLGAGLAVGVAGATACAGTTWVVPGLRPGALVVPAVLLEEHAGVFLQTASMERPVYLRRLADGETSAVLASCTHRGCQPEAFDDRLVCPCHGSEFSFQGAVLAGPADRPLTRYPVVREGDDLIVRLAPGQDR